VLVYPGAPVLAGQQAVQGWFGLQRSLDSVAIDWSPLHVEVSADGSFGVSYGLTAIAARTPAGAPIHFGNYLSAWRRTGPEWRMVAHAQLNLGDLAKASSPGFTAALPPPLNPGHPSIAFARADSAFAAQAAREGAERAFAAFASSDAVTFPPGGPLTRGPAAIGRGVRDGGTPSQWAWHPVAVGGSDGGDLGFTVGEAEIRRGAGSGVYYGKYLTLWRREAGGAIRFLADGGSARPAPAGQ
jgi:ketosteroid isomerase-like protein